MSAVTTAALELERMPISKIEEIFGGLSNPSKMPSYGFSIPAARCITGSRLRAIEGTTCEHCYAFERGRYAFLAVQKALERRYQLLEHPLWVEAFTEILNRRFRLWRRRIDRSTGARRRELERNNGAAFFRWHDSGDLQSVAHLERIAEVARRTSDISHWIPTREYRIVKQWRAAHDCPANLRIRLSAHRIGGFAPTYGGSELISTVGAANDFPAAHHCPAPAQGNACVDCRACWDPAVMHVNYHLH